MRKWLPILVLGLAQFVMVIDGTVMNVSITVVVADLNTTVSSMQLAIATFTLTMAALMLAGAGIGARIGRRRAFVIGTIIYAVGSMTTALASGFGMLFIRWSIIEGIGAALVIPAIAALAAVNYSGKDRAVAYALLGGVAGAAAAAGPLIGGWVTTYFSWRWVFGAETIMIVLLILPLSGKIKDLPVPSRSSRFDLTGVVLSALSMGVVVLALVSASSWGFIRPLNPPFEVFGFAPTIPLVLCGLAVGWVFFWWERRVSANGGEPLVLVLKHVRVLQCARERHERRGGQRVRGAGERERARLCRECRSERGNQGDGGADVATALVLHARGAVLVHRCEVGDRCGGDDPGTHGTLKLAQESVARRGIGGATLRGTAPHGARRALEQGRRLLRELVRE